MTFKVRNDEMIGSFHNDGEFCAIFYDSTNDRGYVSFGELIPGGHSGHFMFTKKKEIVVFENMLKKLKSKMGDTFNKKNIQQRTAIVNDTKERV